MQKFMECGIANHSAMAVVYAFAGAMGVAFCMVAIVSAVWYVVRTHQLQHTQRRS
jgi:hypothetical protein